MKTLVVIPVKRFREAKSRLADVFKPTDRIKFVQQMLLDVLMAVDKAKTSFDVAIIAQDITEMRRVLEEVHISKPFKLFEDKTNTLSDSIKQIAQDAIKNSYSSILVIHDDLPLIQPKDIDTILEKASKIPKCIAIAPSRVGGTNLLLLKPPNVITPSYGPNSFTKHKKQAEANRIPVIEYVSLTTELDIDNVTDLRLLLAQKRKNNNTLKFLKFTHIAY